MKADSPRFSRGLAGLLIILAVIWLGWSIGSKSAFKPAGRDLGSAAGQRFRVSGGSMVPTLFGPSLRTQCPDCGQPFLFDPHSLERFDQELICALCGQRQQVTELRENPAWTTYEGDIIEVVKANKADYSIGQLVAIRWQGKRHVKRVAAVGGDEVGLSQRRLLVNGQRLEDLLAHTSGEIPPDLVVDDDSRRPQSRWSSTPGESSWLRDQQRRWSSRGNSDAPWLVYHHQNVHDHHRPSAVMDDYQYNAAVARQLEPVDRLSVSGIVEASHPARLQVAFWSTDGMVVVDKIVDRDDPFQIRFHDGVSAKNLPVSKETPIAIRANGPTSFTSLRVRRAVEYRFRRDDEQTQYPIRVPEGHYYVVGDNVPFSIDSRNFGPIDAGSILGKVRMVNADRDE